MASDVEVIAKADAYLAKIRKQNAAKTGRLIFALDATASREPTWDNACQLQAEMFHEVESIGRLEIQLVYYRGIDECMASRWTADAAELLRTMVKIKCHAGNTQIHRVLTYAESTAENTKIAAVVFVGDAMEERPEILFMHADALGKYGVPVFMFQEGSDVVVEAIFRQIAERSHGAYARFDVNAAKQLAELLKAVARFAVGGLAALENQTDPGSRKLLGELRRQS